MYSREMLVGEWRSRQSYIVTLLRKVTESGFRARGRENMRGVRLPGPGGGIRQGIRRSFGLRGSFLFFPRFDQLRVFFLFICVFPLFLALSVLDRLRKVENHWLVDERTCPSTFIIGELCGNRNRALVCKLDDTLLTGGEIDGVKNSEIIKGNELIISAMECIFMI